MVPTGVFQATEDYGTAEGTRNERRIERAARELADLMVRPLDRVAGLTGTLSETQETPQDSSEDILESDPAGFRELLSRHDGQPD